MTSEFQVDRAARCVLSGGVVAYPTEAVFGLGCLPDAPAAVERILEIKGRDPGKGLLLIAASLEQVGEYAELPAGEMRQRIFDSWPGPVTWLLAARPGLPDSVTGASARVGIRVTDPPVARRLAARVGAPLVSTSANFSGRAPLRTLLALRRTLGDAVDYILPGALGGLERPTTILDGRDGRVVRAG